MLQLMPSPMKHRKIRVVWSVAWGLVAVLLCVLWARSYWWADAIWFVPVQSNAFRIMSDEGGLTFLTMREPSLAKLGDPPPLGLSHREYWHKGYARATANVSYLQKPFRGFYDYGRSSLQLPYWMAVMLTAATGMAVWMPQLRWRFSLGTLLIATTILAVGLGAGVVMLR